MKICGIIQFLVSLFFSQIAIAAGGWSSGGGGLLKDEVNPWFLNNTPRVSYCIVMDQKNFGASESMARRHVTRAIQYWQQQFSHALLSKLAKFGKLQIASQRFFETDCQSDPDIIFQFGVLDQKQKKFLRKPSEYAAITVRTNYDEVTLRGRGFIYVSPSSGPLAYNHEGVGEDAWRIQNGHLLYLTLVHELGHVFGLQHNGSLGDLMSAGFVEGLLAQATSSQNIFAEEYNFFTLPKAGRAVCPDAMVLDKWQKYFGGQPDDKCFRFVFIHDAKNELFGKTVLKVSAATGPSDVFREMHDVQLSMDRFFPSFMSLIWLPKRQMVFDESDLRDALGLRILGISGFTVGKQGRFALPGEEVERSLLVRFEQGRSWFVIDGVVDGKIIQIL
jgi:hypothetical protein